MDNPDMANPALAMDNPATDNPLTQPTPTNQHILHKHTSQANRTPDSQQR